MAAGRVRLTNSKRRLVAATQLWKCRVCDKLLDDNYEIDHIVGLHDPSWKGDKNRANYIGCLVVVDGKKMLQGGNLQAICAYPCHKLKTELEMIHFQELQQERRSGKSRYFEPTNVCFLPTVLTTSEQLESHFGQFRYRKNTR